MYPECYKDVMRACTRAMAIALACIVSILLLTATASAQVPIPAQSDWVDQGVILPHGNGGQWDRFLFGMMTPCGIVKKGGTYFLYYIGGNQEDGPDGDARNRRLGVATSTDLQTWVKSSSNPIWDYRPTGDWEEGVSSCTAILDGSEIVIYYNGMTSFAPGQVNSEIRMITSTDGVNFGGDRQIIAHDSGCAGCGDEIWPTSVFRDGSTWYVYYSGDLWNIYLATLTSRTSVSNTRLALDLSNNIISAGAVFTDSANLAVFLPYQTFGPPWTTRIRTTTLSNPSSLSAEIGRYDITKVGSHQLYYFDSSTNQWLMFYQTSPGDPSETNIGLMTAPGSSDTTPPADPTGLKADG